MLARDVMTRNVVTVEPDTAVADIARLLLEKRISGVPVVEPDGRLVGIVSEGDLMRRIEEGGPHRGSWWLAMLGIPEERAAEYVRTHGRKARDVMTRHLVTVTPEMPIGKVARLLEEHHVKRVPVVEDGRLVGIISRADLLRAIASRHEAPAAAADDRALRERLLKELETAGLDYHPYVNIVVADGIVHLWGLVSSKAEAEALRVAAESVEGVRGVDSHLAVLPATAHL